MKATLSFDLPEESLEHLDALHGHEWKTVTREIRQQISRYQENSGLFKNAEQCLRELQEVLNALVEQRGLSLE